MFRSLKLLFISIFLVSGSCFALSSEEFDEQYRDLNGQLSKAVFTNMLYSRDYDDKKVPLSEKLESKSKWCDLTKARINLLDFVIQNFSSYKEWVKQNKANSNMRCDRFKSTMIINQLRKSLQWCLPI